MCVCVRARGCTKCATHMLRMHQRQSKFWQMSATFLGNDQLDTQLLYFTIRLL